MKEFNDAYGTAKEAGSIESKPLITRKQNNDDDSDDDSDDNDDNDDDSDSDSDSDSDDDSDDNGDDDGNRNTSHDERDAAIVSNAMAKRKRVTTAAEVDAEQKRM